MRAEFGKTLRELGLTPSAVGLSLLEREWMVNINTRF